MVNSRSFSRVLSVNHQKRTTRKLHLRSCGTTETRRRGALGGNERNVRCCSEIEDTERSDAEETTVKYGLEAGLWKVFTSKDGGGDGLSKGEQAKQLLKRYGSAYLVTSISFAIVSFAACYALVNAGVDVAALLTKVGLHVSDTSEKVGTFAIAYAAHKALSPVRFPPTVALTPVVAKWLGKEISGEEKE